MSRFGSMGGGTYNDPTKPLPNNITPGSVQNFSAGNGLSLAGRVFPGATSVGEAWQTGRNKFSAQFPSSVWNPGINKWGPAYQDGTSDYAQAEQVVHCSKSFRSSLKNWEKDMYECFFYTFIDPMYTKSETYYKFYQHCWSGAVGDHRILGKLKAPDQNLPDKYAPGFGVRGELRSPMSNLDHNERRRHNKMPSAFIPNRSYEGCLGIPQVNYALALLSTIGDVIKTGTQIHNPNSTSSAFTALSRETIWQHFKLGGIVLTPPYTEKYYKNVANVKACALLADLDTPSVWQGSNPRNPTHRLTPGDWIWMIFKPVKTSTILQHGSNGKMIFYLESGSNVPEPVHLKAVHDQGTNSNRVLEWIWQMVPWSSTDRSAPDLYLDCSEEVSPDPSNPTEKKERVYGFAICHGMVREIIHHYDASPFVRTESSDKLTNMNSYLRQPLISVKFDIACNRGSLLI